MSLLATLPLLLSPTLLDTPADGFALASLTYPGASLVRTLPSDELLVFDGTEFAVHDAQGTFLRSLATLPTFVFGSFLELDPSGTFAVLGESSNGDLLRLELATGAVTTLTNLAFNFDAVFESGASLIVSAATSGFGNDVYRVDTGSGATTLLALLQGASGPVALDAHGDLVVGLSSAAFPAPPGSSDLLRFPAAALTGQPVLMEADAAVLSAGFDGAGDLVLDPVAGELYLAESNYGSGVNRLRRVGSSAQSSPVLLDGSPFFSISGLELDPQAAPAALRGFQPAAGGALRYTTTDFFSVFARNELTPARPRATLTGPGAVGVGAFDLVLSGGPPTGTGILLFGPSSRWSPTELALSLPRAAAPLFLGLDPLTVLVAPGPLALDSGGSASASFFNASGATGVFAAQVLLLDVQGAWVGTSDTAFL